jgi:hypothetical protein
MSHNLHSKVLDIENINVNTLKEQLCVRDDLLDKQEIKLLEDKVKCNEDVLFMGNDLFEGFPSNRYQLTIYGILPCGSKTTLEINGIEPYIDIEGDINLSEYTNMANTRSLLLKADLEYSDIKINKGKSFMLYTENENYFIIK